MGGASGQAGGFTRLEPYPAAHVEGPWYHSARARLFALVFGVVLVLGLVVTLFQPVVYRSSATVLMTAPRAIDAPVSEADIQKVAIQRAVLLGNDITARLSQRIQDELAWSLSPLELSGMLAVDAMPGTNLVEMAAEGADREILPPLVNGWIDVYIEVRAEDIAQSKSDTEKVVQEEIAGLAIKLEQARDELERYRETNDLVSVERQENDVMARLDGLNKALNTAIEEEVKARANLDTMRQAVRQGQNLVPQEQRRDVSALENELQSLNAELAEAQRRYTAEYINKQPRLRAVVERIDQLELELAGVYSAGRQAELGTAQQAHAAAQQTVAQLQQKLDEHKSSVAQFNRVYATHEALANDLSRLEELNREAQARLVQVQVSRVEKYPQVSVIERPFAQARRIGPDYGLFIGGSVGIALLLALFAVWLQGFLTPRPAQTPYVALSGVHFYPQEATAELSHSAEQAQRLAAGASPLLKDDSNAPAPDEK